MRCVNVVEWVSHRGMALGSRRRLRVGNAAGDAPEGQPVAEGEEEQPRMGWRKRLKAAEGRYEKEKAKREKAEKALKKVMEAAAAQQKQAVAAARKQFEEELLASP